MHKPTTKVDETFREDAFTEVSLATDDSNSNNSNGAAQGHNEGQQGHNEGQGQGQERIAMTATSWEANNYLEELVHESHTRDPPDSLNQISDISQIDLKPVETRLKLVEKGDGNEQKLDSLQFIDDNDEDSLNRSKEEEEDPPLPKPKIAFNQHPEMSPPLLQKTIQPDSLANADSEFYDSISSGDKPQMTKKKVIIPYINDSYSSSYTSHDVSFDGNCTSSSAKDLTLEIKSISKEESNEEEEELTVISNPTMSPNPAIIPNRSPNPAIIPNPNIAPTPNLGYATGSQMMYSPPKPYRSPIIESGSQGWQQQTPHHHFQHIQQTPQHFQHSQNQYQHIQHFQSPQQQHFHPSPQQLYQHSPPPHFQPSSHHNFQQNQQPHFQQSSQQHYQPNSAQFQKAHQHFQQNPQNFQPSLARIAKESFKKKFLGWNV